MTDESRTEKLARELDAAFQNRADLYRLFYAELEREYGAEAAEAVMVRAVEKRGQEVAGVALRSTGQRTHAPLAKLFCR